MKKQKREKKIKIEDRFQWLFCLTYASSTKNSFVIIPSGPLNGGFVLYEQIPNVFMPLEKQKSEQLSRDLHATNGKSFTSVVLFQSDQTGPHRIHQVKEAL